MKIINHKLYLTIKDMVAAGFTEKSLVDAKNAKYKCWEFIDDPEDKRRVLVGYDALKDVYKAKVQAVYGKNPYEVVVREPILAMVEQDAKAYEYYKAYEVISIDSSKSLPAKRVNEYTRAASWLNLIGQLVTDDKAVKGKMRKRIQEHIKIGVADFYEHVQALMVVEIANGKVDNYSGIMSLPADFPTSYQRLMIKAKEYLTGGYEVLIDKMYGNKLAAKIGKAAGVTPQMPAIEGGVSAEIAVVNDQKQVNKMGGFDPNLYNAQMAVIRAIAAKANNLDAGQVTKMVNTVFCKNQWQPVSRATINDIINRNAHVLTPGRRGSRVYKSEIAMQVKRKAPDYPMFYWTLDGWTVELLYQERGSKGVEYKRMVVVVVLDAFNKYPVGYAIGDVENTPLIKAACKNALTHVAEVLGAPFRPWQVQSDHYGIKQMAPFYQIMTAYYTPAEVGNAKAKVIEPYFRRLNKEYCQKMPNWTGFNVTAKQENQVNREYLDKTKSNVPDKKGVIKQIERIIERERALRVMDFEAKFEDLPASDRLTMSQEDWLMMFGKPIGKTNRITGQGVVKVINGESYTYDSFDVDFRANMHLDWTLIGDTDDMSKVLAVSPDGRKKFLLEQKRVLPMSLKETEQEDVDYRMRIKHYNEEREQEIINMYATDADVTRQIVERSLDESNEDELALKLMLTYNGQQKDALRKAKRLEIAEAEEVVADNSTWQAMQMEYLTSKTDFSRYED